MNKLNVNRAFKELAIEQKTPERYQKIIKEYILGLVHNSSIDVINAYENNAPFKLNGDVFSIITLTDKLVESNLTSLSSFYSAWQSFPDDKSRFVLWKEKKLKQFGVQRYPEKLHFDSIVDVIDFVDLGVIYGQLFSFFNCLNLYSDKLPLLLNKHAKWFFENGLEQTNLFIQCLDWLLNNNGSDVYIRQIDVEGADTKWIENNRFILTEAVKLILEESVGTSLEELLGLRKPESMIRFRVFGEPLKDFFRGCDDISLTLSGLKKISEQISHLIKKVVVLENEVTGLVFDGIDDGICFFKLGNAVPVLADVPFVSSCGDCLYFGDLDVDGLLILSRYRKKLPHVNSVMMNVDVFKKHYKSSVCDRNKLTSEELYLNEEELRLLSFILKQKKGGNNSRLEQELIPSNDIDHCFKQISKGN